MLCRIMLASALGLALGTSASADQGPSGWRGQPVDEDWREVWEDQREERLEAWEEAQDERREALEDAREERLDQLEDRDYDYYETPNWAERRIWRFHYGVPAPGPRYYNYNYYRVPDPYYDNYYYGDRGWRFEWRYGARPRYEPAPRYYDGYGRWF